jgi:4-carboxymuconolactone decarboxylase
MTNQDLFVKGMEVRRALLGEESFKTSNSGVYSHPVMQDFIEVTATSVFGALWARPGLDLKTRALVVMVSDVATGQMGELPIHMVFALRQGWTPTEIVEVLLQLMGYVGAPKIRESMVIAVRIIEGYKESLRTAQKSQVKRKRKPTPKAVTKK